MPALVSSVSLFYLVGFFFSLVYNPPIPLHDCLPLCQYTTSFPFPYATIFQSTNEHHSRLIATSVPHPCPCRLSQLEHVHEPRGWHCVELGLLRSSRVRVRCQTIITRLRPQNSSRTRTGMRNPTRSARAVPVSATRTRMDLFSHTRHAISKPLRSEDLRRSRPAIWVFLQGTSYTNAKPCTMQADWLGLTTRGLFKS